jgi:putative endonuclease
LNNPFFRLKHRSSFRYSLGPRGEAVAVDFLRRRGYEILATNYRCRLGEIDAVARKNGTTVFIEIKTRSSFRFGLPQEAVSFAKRRKIVRLAQWYLKDKRLDNVPVSFAVLAVFWQHDGDPEFKLIENAFSVDS